MIAAHQPVDTFNTVVDIAVGTRLFTVAPHFDLVHVTRQGDLATNGRGRFLASAVERTEWTEDVMEPHDARVETEVFRVVTANSFHVELFPAVTVFSISRLRVFFSSRCDVRVVLFLALIDAGAPSVKITSDAIDSRRFDGMQIDQRVVANDDGFVGFDKADAAHVCGKTVDLVDAFSCFQTVVGEREIEKLKVVRCCWFVFRFLNVNAAHPVTAINKILSQMMTDKPTSPCDQYTCRFRHSLRVSQAEWP